MAQHKMISLRLSKDLVERVDRVAKWMQKQELFGARGNVVRSDAMRLVLVEGLKSLEKKVGLASEQENNLEFEFSQPN